MFIVMFEFVVKEGFEEQFIEAWPKATQGIYLFRGSMGSRLHRNKNGELIAYAQWPNREVWEKSAEIKLNSKYEEQLKLMRDSLNLESTKTLYEMDVEIDFLQVRPISV